jgi:UDP-N-acetylmuramate dehydrogenase
MHLEENISLAPFTTLRIGGPARYFARITSESDLLEAIGFARVNEFPIFALGGGSNLLVPDSGFPGVVLHIQLPASIAITRTPGEIHAQVSAGTDWNALVLNLCQQGIAGLESLAGIPGLVGGAPIQNIGAYGAEVSQTITAVRALDLETLTFVTLSNAHCHFAYRSSIFNTTRRNRYIVTQVQFRFDPTAIPNLTYADLRNHFAAHPNPTPLEVYAAVRAIRATKGMLIDPAHLTPDTRSAGSFFKNPIIPAATLAHIAETLGIPAETIPNWPTTDGNLKLPAAWLIERAGFPKGYAPTPESPVGISSRHTLALINRTGTATHADLMALANQIIDTVQTRFAITLHPEPVTLS